MLDKDNNAVYNPSHFHAKGGKRKTKNIFRRNKKNLRKSTKKIRKNTRNIFSRRKKYS